MDVVQILNYSRHARTEFNQDRRSTSLRIEKVGQAGPFFVLV